MFWTTTMAATGSKKSARISFQVAKVGDSSPGNGMLGGIPHFWTSSHNSVDHMAESLPQCLTTHFNHVTPIAETSPSIYFWKTPTPIISRLGSKCTTVPRNCHSTCSPTTQHGWRVQQMKRQLWLAWKPNWMAGRQTNRLTNKIFTV